MYLRRAAIASLFAAIVMLAAACSDAVPEATPVTEAPPPADAQPTRSEQNERLEPTQHEAQTAPRSATSDEADALLLKIHTWQLTLSAVDFDSNAYVGNEGGAVEFILFARVRGAQAYSEMRTLIHSGGSVTEILAEELIVDGFVHVRVPEQEESLADIVRAEYGIDEVTWARVIAVEDVPAMFGLDPETAGASGLAGWGQELEREVTRAVLDGETVWRIEYQIDVDRLGDAAPRITDPGMNALMDNASTAPVFEFAGMLRIRQWFSDDGEPLRLEVSGDGASPNGGHPLQVEIVTTYPAPDESFVLPEPTPFASSQLPKS